MDAIEQAIESLSTVRDAYLQRAELIGHILGQLRQVEPQRPQVSAAPVPRRAKQLPAAPGANGSNGSSSLHGVSDADVRRLLKDGPIRPSQFADAFRLSLTDARQVAHAFITKGLIVATGATNGRRLQLAAKEAP